MQTPRRDMCIPSNRRDLPQTRTRNRVLIATAVIAVTLAACGSSLDTGRAPYSARKTQAAAHGTNVPRPTSDAPQLPDVSDPAVRQRFAASFADGYFTP